MIIFDTETTGLPKPSIADLNKQPKIIEFAAIKLDKELNEIDRLEFLVNPKEKLDPYITKLTGINDSDLIDQPEFKSHFPKLTNFFFGQKYAFAHNCAFDMNMMRFELQRLGRLTQFPWPPVQICTVTQTMKMKGFRLKLGILYQHLFDEEMPKGHRAMVDVEALTRCVKELINNGTIKV